MFLLAWENQTAKTITNLCKLAKQDVYRVLDELFEKGLIEKRFQSD
ncbi:MAG: helix-turn-helix domain-containing protein [Candidatus Bathyarchaeia archaeon]